METVLTTVCNFRKPKKLFQLFISNCVLFYRANVYSSSIWSRAIAKAWKKRQKVTSCSFLSWFWGFQIFKFQFVHGVSLSRLCCGITRTQVTIKFLFDLLYLVLINKTKNSSTSRAGSKVYGALGRKQILHPY